MEISVSKKRSHQAIRARRTRARLKRGFLPRLSVFRSGRHIYAQIIDDRAGKTLVSAHDVASGKPAKKKKDAPLAAAAQVGAEIAKRALEKKIVKVVFDRGGYRYHGRVKALADQARKNGLQF